MTSRRRSLPAPHTLPTSVLLAIALPVALTACTGRDSAGGSDSACRPVPSATTTAAEPAAGRLSVVEQAYTQIDEPGRHRAPGETVSVGAVVRNTDDRVAYRTQISIAVRDADGRSAVASGSGELLRQEIPILMPGEQIAVGAWTYVRDARPGTPATVAAVEVTVGATHWLPPAGFGQVTAAHGRTVRDTDEPASGKVDFAVTSPYCAALRPRGVALLFRDPTGGLVGGSLVIENSRPRCQPGTGDEFVTVPRSIPLTADPGRTETAVYCDVAAPSTVPSDAPIN